MEKCVVLAAIYQVFSNNTQKQTGKNHHASCIPNFFNAVNARQQEP